MTGHSAAITTATADDADGIRALFQQPLPGPIQLQCCPPLSNPWTVRQHAIVIRDSSAHIIAHGARSVRRLWWNGKPQLIGYLGGMRRDQQAAGDGWRLIRSLRQLRQTHCADEVTWDFTSIMSDNKPALQLLTRLRNDVAYKPWHAYRTWVMTRAALQHIKHDSSFAVAWATDADMPALLSLQEKLKTPLSSVINETDHVHGWIVIRDHNKIVAGAQLIDPDYTTQFCIANYATWMRWSRPLLNVGLSLTKRPVLPPAGSNLALQHVAHVLCEEPRFFPSLLHGVNQFITRRDCLLVYGCGINHPYAAYLKNIPAWHFDSHLFILGDMPLAHDPIAPETFLL